MAFNLLGEKYHSVPEERAQTGQIMYFRCCVLANDPVEAEFADLAARAEGMGAGEVG